MSRPFGWPWVKGCTESSFQVGSVNGTTTQPRNGDRPNSSKTQPDTDRVNPSAPLLCPHLSYKLTLLNPAQKPSKARIYKEICKLLFLAMWDSEWWKTPIVSHADSGKMMVVLIYHSYGRVTQWWDCSGPHQKMEIDEYMMGHHSMAHLVMERWHYQIN